MMFFESLDENVGFAPVDRIDDGIIVCKVELHTIQENRAIPFGKKKTKIMYLNVSEVPEEVGAVRQGDILIVEHDGNQITHVLSKDKEEKQRRIDFLNSL